MTHPTRWEKIAIVTDNEWLRHSVDIFGYLIPGEIKSFSTDGEAAPAPGSRADLDKALQAGPSAVCADRVSGAKAPPEAIDAGAHQDIAAGQAAANAL